MKKALAATRTARPPATRLAAAPLVGALPDADSVDEAAELALLLLDAVREALADADDEPDADAEAEAEAELPDLVLVERVELSSEEEVDEADLTVVAAGEVVAAP